MTSDRHADAGGAVQPAPAHREIFTPELLDRCISCGFCLPVCPTYRLTGREAASPRGRITLMRALEEGRLPDDDPTLAEQASFCLGCRACETVCPAGVRYGELLEEWRVRAWRGRRRPVAVRGLSFAVASPARVRSLGLLRRHARTGRPAPADRPHLMLGCFERILFPQVSRDALAACPDLDAPSGQGCCGALHAHNGDLAQGRAMARALGRALPGTIVSTAGGCAAHLADVLGHDRVREVSQFLVEDGGLDLDRLTPLTVAGRPMRLALQDSCHLRNGMGVTQPPREILRRLGEYVELPSAGSCCGAAGSYATVRPADAARVLAPHLAEIEEARVDVVAAVNPGCLRQLQQGLRRSRSAVRAVHLVELVVRSLAGGAPRHPDAAP